MSIIYHITPRIDWEAAQAAGSYAADSLASEGFIHCSTPEQVIATANRLFAGRAGLVLLSIETAGVREEIRYENLAGGASLFPHVYGPLDVSSVVAVHDFSPDKDGRFVLPVTLRP